MNPEPQMIQYGLHGVRDHQIIISEAAAAKVSNSGLQLLGEYWKAQGDKKALRQAVKAPPLKQLNSIYYGIQAHQMLFYLNIYFRMEQPIGQLTPLKPDSYCLWQKPPARQVWEYILSSVVTNVQHSRGIQRALLRTRWSFNLWRQMQNFYVNLTPISQRTFHESRLFSPGKREGYWNARTIERQLEQLLRNAEQVMGNRRAQSCFEANDMLLETPINLYLRADRDSALMCWVQPDQVSIYANQIIVYDHKFQKELLDKQTMDNFERLQILMLAIAGGMLVRQCMIPQRRRDQFNEVPCYRVVFETIPWLVDKVRVIYQQPDILTEAGTFREVEMTLSENELAAAIVDLEYVVRFLSKPANRNGLYEFSAAHKRAQEGVTPEAMFLPDPMPIQQMLPI